MLWRDKILSHNSKDNNIKRVEDGYVEVVTFLAIFEKSTKYMHIYFLYSVIRPLLPMKAVIASNLPSRPGRIAV